MADNKDKADKADKQKHKKGEGPPPSAAGEAQKAKGAGKEGGAGSKKDKRGGGDKKREDAPAVVSTAEAVAPRIAEKYLKQVIPALTKDFGYKNPNQVPKLQKIVVNMG